MRSGPPMRLPPTRFDLATSRLIRRNATPVAERAGKIFTLAADERPLIAAAALFWLSARCFHVSPHRQRQADHLLICTLVSSIVPHLLKLAVERQRPDRKVMRGIAWRHGIPHSGKPKDSFPSGHATHLGALAAAITRTAPGQVAALAWAAALSLASTRLLLLAHYVTDVLSGLALGVAIERVVARFCLRDPRQR